MRSRMSGARQLSALLLGGVREEEVAALTAAGFCQVHDVLRLPAHELAVQSGLSDERASVVLSAARGDARNTEDRGRQPHKGLNSSLLVESNLNGRTVLDLLEDESGTSSIISCCQELDRILGGGFPIGQITEICGVPGVGKTQMSMQLACSVQIPKLFGGCEGAAVYIDTEGSLSPSRLLEIAHGLIMKMKAHSRQAGDLAKIAASDQLTAEGMLERIHVFRVQDYIEQMAVVQLLPLFLNSHSDVNLIVMDSVAFHFRHGFRDLAKRTRFLSTLANQLKIVAQKFKVAVVLSNQMTVSKNSAGTRELIPALGPSWAHCCNSRLTLSWKSETRVASLVKSSWLKQDEASFLIAQNGIGSCSS